MIPYRDHLLLLNNRRFCLLLNLLFVTFAATNTSVETWMSVVDIHRLGRRKYLLYIRCGKYLPLVLLGLFLYLLSFLSSFLFVSG